VNACLMLLFFYVFIFTQNRCTSLKSMYMYIFYKSEASDFYTRELARVWCIDTGNFVSTGAHKYVNLSLQAWPCYLLVVVRRVV
jgi:hypothetical protein